MFACTSLSDSGVDYMGHKLHLESNKAKTNEKEKEIYVQFKRVRLLQ